MSSTAPTAATPRERAPPCCAAGSAAAASTAAGGRRSSTRPTSSPASRSRPPGGSLLVTLIATGAGMAVTLVGLPILAVTIVLWTQIAETERWRAQGLPRDRGRSPYRQIEAGSFLGPGVRATRRLGTDQGPCRLARPRLPPRRLLPARDRHLLHRGQRLGGRDRARSSQPITYWAGGGLESRRDLPDRHAAEALGCFVVGARRPRRCSPGSSACWRRRTPGPCARCSARARPSASSS